MKKYFAVIKLLEKDLDEGNNGNIKWNANVKVKNTNTINKYLKTYNKN